MIVLGKWINLAGEVIDFVVLESHPKWGASWEGFALEQVLSICGDREVYFWATHVGAELDLLIFHKGTLLSKTADFRVKQQVTQRVQEELE